MNLAQLMENYHLEHNTYLGASLEGFNLKENIVKNNYSLKIADVRDESYLILAKPSSHQAINDAICGTLFLNEKNEKKVSGKNLAEECW